LPNADAESPAGRQGAGPARSHRVRPVRSKKDPDTISFYRHAALTTRFRRFGGTWYCQLGPDYCFTSDGREEYRYADTLLAGIKRRDRHAAVAGWTRTWATYLTRQADLFAAERAIVFGELATFEVGRGIDDRLWGPAPEQVTDEEPDESTDGGDVEAALAAIGIETADLSALDDGADVDEAPAPAVEPRTKGRRRSGGPGRQRRATT
jgi:hypothetical protein